jgi:hypothetical protein
MKNKRPRTKLAGKIDKSNRKEMAKERESKKRNGLGRPSSRVHPIGELTSQYGAAENELERVGSPKLNSN